ncbi:MAG: hypothetical protein C0516_13225 [Gemmatimonas sp.]|nr:hypothetical protein [Gemmatimonas sp.]
MEAQVHPLSTRWPKSAAVLAVLALGACAPDQTVSSNPEVQDFASAARNTVDYSSVTLSGEVNLKVGTSTKLSVRTSSRSRGSIKWQSSNPNAATVNSQGNVTGKAVGSAYVTASGFAVSETYLVSVTPAYTLTSFTVSPTTGTALAPGQTRQFSTQQLWSDGQTRNFGVTYTATGGSISSSGLFTAGSVAGSFMVIANCLCGALDTAFVTVELPAQLTKITVSPKTVSLNAGATQQFGATANWSTGATTLPPITWSATGGSISTGGLYTAPTTAGTYRVIVAHSGGTLRDTATVTVAAPPTSPPPSGLFPTPSWSVERNFNGGLLGQSVNRTPSGFDDAGGGTVFATDKSFEGGMSGKMSIDSAEYGFGQWGGVVAFPQKLVAGDELWLDLYVYLPADFQIITSPKHLKFLRIRTETSAGANSGYNDLYLVDDDQTEPQFKFIKEIQDIWYPFGAQKAFTRERWHRFTVHYRFDAVSRSAGGRSQVRIWQNSQLVLDEKRVQTLTNATDYANGFYLFTYWNGASPKKQTAWVDNIRLSNRKPAWVADLPGVDNY